MDESINNYELETARCEVVERKELNMLKESQMNIDAASAEASAAKTGLLRAQETTQTIEEQTEPLLEKQLEETDEKCKGELDVMKVQLASVTSDMTVLKPLFGSFACTDTALIEVRGGSNTSSGEVEHAKSDEQGTSLIQCPCREDGRPAVQVRHARAQAQLLKLRSQEVQAAVHDFLLESLAQTEERQPARVRSVVLSQEGGSSMTGLAAQESQPETCPGSEDMGAGINGSTYRGCQTQTTKGNACMKWTSLNATDPEQGTGDHAFCRNPLGVKETIWCYTSDPMDPNVTWQYCTPLAPKQPPSGLTKSSCEMAGQCKVMEASCPEIRDKFLSIYGGVVDKVNQLTEDISTTEANCGKSKEEITAAETVETSKLTSAQGDIAAFTKAGVETEQHEEQASKFDEFLKKEYALKMKECCDNKNNYMTQLCGLKKIRHHLFESSGEPANISDCEVSDWTDGECSASCEGGTQKRTRSVTTPSANGTKCPPLEMDRECNTHKCPINCEVSVWTGWSDCSAPCGGGVMSRKRSVTVEPKNGGTPCPEEGETQSCNPQACNRDCELGDWGEWSGCSKFCLTGHRSRRMAVKEEQSGTGTCADPDSEERLGFEECNKETCMSKLPANRSFLQCHSVLDVVLLLDGSASYGAEGFEKMQAMAQLVVAGLIGGPVQASALVFGGPESFEALDKCTGGNMSSPPDVLSDCGMHWVSKLSNDTAGVAAKIAQAVYPDSTTLTSMALGQAMTELANGRTEASSVVVVVTDGEPMSQKMTASAAAALKASAKLIWMQVGRTAPAYVELLKSWVSKPWQDNLIEVASVNSLPTPVVVNGMLAAMCPDVS